MSLEPWPPLHARPEVRKRLIRGIVLGILLVIVGCDYLERLAK